MPSELPRPVERESERPIHGNAILFRAFLILTMSSAIWMLAGLSIGRGAKGALVWPYIIPSLVFIALIVAYRARVRNAGWFTNKPRTLSLLTLSWIACAVGLILSVAPF